MAICHNCGHRVEFRCVIRGVEIRTYNANGDLDGIDSQNVETVTAQCANCNSDDVELP